MPQGWGPRKIVFPWARLMTLKTRGLSLEERTELLTRAEPRAGPLVLMSNTRNSYTNIVCMRVHMYAQWEGSHRTFF